MMTPEEILKKHWGYDEFRPLQREIVDSVLAGHDTLGLLPTGGGKSITFQVPGLLLPGLTIVVTPLISLMKDQVDNLRAHDIPATFLHSGLTRAESRLGIKKAELGKVKFLYVSPERLASETFRQTMKNFAVSLIVVDEAHCISQWGYDFRPSYLNISYLRKLFPSAPMLALTASATPRVVDDICSSLEFRPGFKVYRRSFARSNIQYIVRNVQDKPERLLRVLAGTSGSAIVYVRSRKRTREIAEMLAQQGVTAEYYHAGLAPEEKDERQQRWKEGRTRVMVATNAFGMGIDKPDVRAVVHFDLPSSVEEYYQEAGRAGRDGLPCFAVILASPHDKALLSRRLADSFPPREYVAKIYDLACIYIDLAMGEGFNQVFDFDFARFVQTNGLQEAPARSALRLLTLAGYLEFVEDVDARARVMVVMPKHELYDLTLTPVEEELLQYILRSCAGVFADYVNISETVIASNLQMSAQEVYETLLTLTRKHAVHYVPRRQQPYLYFPSRRIMGKHIVLSRHIYDERRAQMEERINAMKRLAFDAGVCRANAILEYFGEEPDGVCGTCDVCREQKRPVKIDELALYQLIASNPEITVQELTRRSGYNPDRLTSWLREQVDKGKLRLSGLSVSLAQ